MVIQLKTENRSFSRTRCCAAVTFRSLVTDIRAIKDKITSSLCPDLWTQSLGYCSLLELLTPDDVVLSSCGLWGTCV